MGSSSCPDEVASSVGFCCPTNLDATWLLPKSAAEGEAPSSSTMAESAVSSARGFCNDRLCSWAMGPSSCLAALC